MTNVSDTTPPLVAIITPVYNGAAFLREAMDAVQAQTYPNLVHVVLDNASTDATPTIIAEYRNAKVPVVTRRNGVLLPLYDNWNAAFELAPLDAKYVRLLCADDRMHPDCTTRMVEIAEGDDAILLVGTTIAKNSEAISFFWPEDRVVMDGDDVVRGFFRSELGFFAVHMLMRRSVMDWRKPLFDTSYVGADFEAVLGILRHGKFGMVHDRLGWVRIHEGSQTSQVTLRKNTHYADWLSALYRHGPSVLSDAEFRKIAKRYERHYLRKTLRWRRQFGADAARPHFARLQRERGSITAKDYVEAFGDWLLIRAGFRSYWTGWPN